MGNDREDFSLSRRAFLVRSGVLGAIAAAPGLLLTSRQGAAFHEGPIDLSPEEISSALWALTADTMKGVAAFVLPGNDDHSKAQQVASGTPGGVAAAGDRYIMWGLDQAVALPKPQLLAAMRAFGAEYEQDQMTVVDELFSALTPEQKWFLEHLDPAIADEIDDLVANHPIQGSTMVALLLNLLATRINPAALNGLLLSPFSRLTWEEKARVFADLEAPDPVLVSGLQRHLDEPLQSHLPAALPLLANGTLNLGAFGSYNEWSVFDPATRSLTQRPLGWDLCNYQPDAPPVAEGWDEFRGYYQNRRKLA